tara:strand:+ start:72 stop:290 length:219 start_codon:yes stop_codon:yes gene_type:complete
MTLEELLRQKYDNQEMITEEEAKDRGLIDSCRIVGDWNHSSWKEGDLYEQDDGDAGYEYLLLDKAFFKELNN